MPVIWKLVTTAVSVLAGVITRPEVVCVVPEVVASVTVGVCSWVSSAPISILPATIRGKPALVGRQAVGVATAGSPAPSAGLPAKSATVSTVPPLFCKGPSLAVDRRTAGADLIAVGGAETAGIGAIADEIVVGVRGRAVKVGAIGRRVPGDQAVLQLQGSVGTSPSLSMPPPNAEPAVPPAWACRLWPYSP